MRKVKQEDDNPRRQDAHLLLLGTRLRGLGIIAWNGHDTSSPQSPLPVFFNPTDVSWCRRLAACVGISLKSHASQDQVLHTFTANGTRVPHVGQVCQFGRNRQFTRYLFPLPRLTTFGQLSPKSCIEDKWLEAIVLRHVEKCFAPAQRTAST